MGFLTFFLLDKMDKRNGNKHWRVKLAVLAGLLIVLLIVSYI